MRLIDADTAAVYTPFSHASMLTFLNGVPTVDAIPVEEYEHVTMGLSMNRDDLVQMPSNDFAMNYISNKFSDQFASYVANHVRAVYDLVTNRIYYSLDLYIRR